MKNILILYGSYGGGHKSAANAIKQYIENHYREYQPEIVDCVEYVSKFINKVSVGAYNKMTKSAPWLWKKVYYNSNKGLLSKISNGTNHLMARKLLHLIQEKDPSHIICTHMFASQMCGLLKRKEKINCDISTILTDYEIHNQWLEENKYIKNYFVAHNEMKQAMIEQKIDENKIFSYGIPMSERFLESFDKDKIYSDFELEKNKKTILFFGGGAMGLGKENTCKILNILANKFDDVQIVAVSGKNEEMNKAFNEIVKKTNSENRIKVLEFTNKVPELMSISNVVITKPGGLTTTESLASGLPIIVINPLPGQEEANAKFIEDSNAGVWLKKEDNIEEVLSKVILDDKRILQMSENAKKLAKKDSTRKICEQVFA